ncbi:hypothetical protein GCM10010967_30740 [Dyadobacter beijingensis]|uniref:Secretion system C-terminal sorting domain-containing protein n=1 Tax=Dyadobacter beijingensis TaxID=365489 RepID=A0ABQ2HZC6_9BACT|nr:T9SS type A sorting domain-containing protein [Dyadobacter beijingensis]GGM95189.1 hypothetical protein GCM10010967_30740 [Dyadobacter beijingensis]
MKVPSLALLCFLFYCPSVFAQLSIGARDFVIKGGTHVNFYGLTFNSNPDLVIANNNLTVSTTPIPGTQYNSITRVYNFSAPVNFNGVVGVFYQDSELNGNSKVRMQIYYSPTAGGTFMVHAGSTSNTATNYVFNHLTSPLGVVTLINPPALPVNLISFNAVEEKGVVKLDWTTSEESNSKIFEVQSSKEGRNWLKIGEVSAAGESSVTTHYHFTDLFPFFGRNYYRLKMIDHDETFAHSSTRYVDMSYSIAATVFPNPVSDQATLSLQDWSLVKEIDVTDLRGNRLFKIPIDHKANDSKTIAMDGVPSGTYLINIRRKDGLVNSLKVVRQ